MRLLYFTFNGFPTKKIPNRGIFSEEQIKALSKYYNNIKKIDMAGNYDQYNDDVRVIPDIRGRNIINFFQWLKELNKINVNSSDDVAIISFYSIWSLPLLIYLRVKNIPAFYIAHGGDVLFRTNIEFFIAKLIFKMCNGIMVVSEFTYHILSLNLRVNNKSSPKIRLILNGVDHNKIRSSEKDLTALRKVIKNSDKKIFLTISNYVKRKNTLKLIELLIERAEKGEDFLHILIGDGEYFEECYELVKSKNKFENFLFLNRVPDQYISDFYRISDCYLQLSITDFDFGQTEGFGITYAEAACAGVPSISFSLTGVSSVISDGLTGKLINPTSSRLSEDFEMAILVCEKLKNEEDLNQKISNYAKDKFDWDLNAKFTNDFITLRK